MSFLRKIQEMVKRFMARILKGLGCDYAMALEGGGSTQMYVKNTGELTGNSRNVKSTLGFFLR